MGDSSNEPLAPESSVQQQQQYQQTQQFNLAMLYYGFFVIATAAIVLAIYHCLIIKWFADTSSNSPTPSWATPGGPTSASRARKLVELASSKYCKNNTQEGHEECVVCLSVFEEGEDVRELPRCKHSFHVPCIDTWLSSHLECPLCRSPVTGVATQPESSLAAGSIV